VRPEKKDMREWESKRQMRLHSGYVVRILGKTNDQERALESKEILYIESILMLLHLKNIFYGTLR